MSRARPFILPNTSHMRVCRPSAAPKPSARAGAPAITPRRVGSRVDANEAAGAPLFMHGGGWIFGAAFGPPGPARPFGVEDGVVGRDVAAGLRMNAVGADHEIVVVFLAVGGAHAHGIAVVGHRRDGDAHADRLAVHRLVQQVQQIAAPQNADLAVLFGKGAEIEALDRRGHVRRPRHSRPSLRSAATKSS